MIFYKPTQIPLPWFDEGWTLSVARNWVEKGVYARLLEGKPVSYEMMAGSFPVTVPVGISFRLFGIGVLQGRLPNILITVGMLWLLFFFSQSLYNERVGIITLFVVLFATTAPHVLVMGRQALSDIPMIFFLVLGLLGFYFTLSRSNWFLVLTIFSWGISITCKLVPLPFLSFALFVCLLVSMVWKRYQVLYKLIIAWIGMIVVYFAFVWIENWLTRDLALYLGPMKGNFVLAGFILNKQVRLDTFKGFITFGIPTFLGLCFGSYYIFKNRKEKNETWFFINLLYIALCLSWLSWYVFFSIGWAKYFFPIAFLSSVYLALLLDQFTQHFNIKSLILTISGDLRHFRLKCISIKAMIAIFIVIDGMIFTYFYLSILNKEANDAPYHIAAYINQTSSKDALVETYDSELHFLIDRPMYFPPDQIQVELNRRFNLDPNTPIKYDPLSSDPDFIIIGPFSRGWKLYETIVNSGKFQKVFTDNNYEVYKQIR
jgi:hypothetical protein